MDLLRRAMGSAGLHSVGLSGGFMTTLGSGAGGFGISTLGGDTMGLLFGDGEWFGGWDAVVFAYF